MPNDTRMISGCQYLLANHQADEIIRICMGLVVK